MLNVVSKKILNHQDIDRWVDHQPSAFQALAEQRRAHAGAMPEKLAEMKFTQKVQLHGHVLDGQPGVGVRDLTMSTSQTFLPRRIAKRPVSCSSSPSPD
jgi:hypothetical protein